MRSSAHVEWMDGCLIAGVSRFTTTGEASVAGASVAGSSDLDADAASIELIVVPLGDGSVDTVFRDGDESKAAGATGFAVLEDNGISDVVLLEGLTKRIISSGPGESSNKKLAHLISGVKNGCRKICKDSDRGPPL